MKKLILVMAVMFTALTGVKAQGLQQPIPDDPQVRKGVLDNGMTYYVRQNDEPAGQADFYIVSHVGAIQEEDSQIGLAHFLEHMAFNGTKNLPDKQLMNWLEGIGVKFGANLNASTGQDVTMYLVSSVPVSRESIIDSALLIMHDWSHFITLDHQEIDNERGVIREELRSGSSSGRRMFEKQMPYLYGDDNRYGNRNVIGTDENLANFSYEEIENFYTTWYRPDYQAVIVVGDIDPDAVVEKIKTLMADIPAAAEGAPEKEIITITPNDEPVVKIFSDPELTSTSVEFYIGRDALPMEVKNTPIATIVDYVGSYITSALNERLAEITNKPNAPFTSAYAYDTNVIPTADAFGVGVEVNGTDVARAFETIYTEIQRMAQYGLTVVEFERAKANFERRIERAYDSKDDRRNSSYVYEYISNFTSNTAMPDAETQQSNDKMALDQITIEAVNAMVADFINLENQKLFVSTPDKNLSEMPTEEALAEIITKINEAEIEAPVQEVSNIPLIPEGTVLNGSKVSKTEKGQFGETVWTLQNGMRVIVYPNDFKKDEIQMSVYALGGTSLMGDEMVFASQNLAGYFATAGLGQFTATDLRKQMAGKSVSLRPYVSGYYAGFNGATSPKDLESLFQLLYLNFTSQRWDNESYNVMIEQTKNQLSGLEAEPQIALVKNLYKTLYNNNPRQQLMLSPEQVDEVTFERLQQVWDTLFANPADFTIQIVGNVNLAELQPMVEKYVGSLQKGKANSKWVDRGVRFATGENENRFEQQMETPNTTIVYMFTGELPYTLKNTLAVDALGQIIRTRYTESIREELGGTYSPQAMAAMTDLPVSAYQLQVYVATNADLSDKVEELIMKGLTDMANEVTEEELNKIKEYLLKEYVDDINLNYYWNTTLTRHYMMNQNFHVGYEDTVKALSTDDIEAIAQKMLKDNNVVRIIMEGFNPNAAETTANTGNTK